MSDGGARAMGGRWQAAGRTEPLLAAIFCVCLAIVLAFNLRGSGPSGYGNPSAIVVLVAVAAGWTLRLRWAAPVWVLCAVVCAAGVVTGALYPINAIAIVVAAAGAGFGGHFGSAAFRDSMVVVDRQVDLIRRASALLAAPSDLHGALDEVLLATVEALAGLPDGDEVGAAVLAVEDGRARRIAAVGGSAVPELGLEDPATVGGSALLARVLRGAGSALADDSGHAGLARVDVAGRPWGVLVASRPGVRFADRELTLLRSIADLAGVAVDSRLRAADLDRLRHRLQVTLDLAVAIGASLDPTDVATGILRRAGDALDADRATLARIRGDEAELVALHDRARPGPATWIGGLLSTARLREQPTVGEAMERLVPVAGGPLVPSAMDERYREEVADVRAVLVLPLVGNGELVGLLTLSRRRDAPFTNDDLATVGQFGSVAVLALMNSWAHTELERGRRSVDETARHLGLAIEAAKDVGFETEPDRVTRRLLLRCAEAVGADRGSIGGIQGEHLVVEAEWPDSDGPRPAIRAMSLAGVPGLLETLRAGEPVQHSSPAGNATRHSVQYPLIAGGELVGVLTLGRETGGPFDESELQALRQLTSLTALTLRAARLLAQARGLGAAKSEFLNMTAHELRTPLAVVRGYLSMMADGTLPVPESTRTQVVTLLCQKTDELSAMVEQILTAAQIQAGGVQLKRQVFDLREAIQVAVERARPRAEQAGAELWVQPLPEPVRVEAVRTSVGRILDNLVGNAITYGNAMPVRVSVEVGEDVLVRVEDQGLGISPEQQARLFEPFFRVDQPSVQGIAGAGLGLAVSRRLAELSDGSLDLEWTQEGAGSTFVLRLPAAVGPGPAAREVPR